MVTAMSDYDWWCLFLPWHNDLHRHGGLVDPRVPPVAPERGDPKSFVWLQVIPHKKVPRLVIEGLELLALLAYVDWNAWKKMVFDLWPKRENKWEQALAFRPANVGVQINYSMDAKVDFVFKVLARSSQEPKSPNQFVLARRKLLDMLASQGQRVTEIPLRVTRDYYKKVDLQLTKIQETVKLQQQLCAPPPPRSKKPALSYHGLRVRAITLDMGEDKVKLSRLQLLGEIAACGVTIDYMHPAPLAVCKENPSRFMDAISHLLPVSGHSQEQHWRGAQYIRIDSEAGTYPGVFGALRVNDSVQSAYFYPCVNEHHADAKRRLAWSWLAYGLFSKPATGGHRVQKLFIWADTLDQVAVDGVAGILRSDDPLALLLNLEVGRISQETISASQFALIDPATAGASQQVVKWSSGRMYNGLEVIDRGQDWMSVLLPGWGKAWVHCGDVEMAWPSASSANQVQPIPKLGIHNFRIASKDALTALLRLIGSGTRDLHLDYRYGYSPGRSEVNELLPQIFRACPHLQSFETSCNDNLQVFVDAFASRSCRLEKLTLCGIELTDERDSLMRFFDVLGDETHPMARHLKVLIVRTLRIDTLVDAAVSTALMTMLEKNHRLHHLELPFRRDDADHPQRAMLGNQLVRFDQQPLTMKVDLSSKLAFLSVISGSPAYQTQQLDSHIVSTIFKFATEKVTRRVIFKSY